MQAHERHLTITVPIAKDADVGAVKAALAAYTIQDRDRIYVAPISPFTEQSVYVEGHVFRTGKYAYHPGMKVTDLLRSWRLPPTCTLRRVFPLCRFTWTALPHPLTAC